jgi:hypothetical protein
MVSRTMRTVLLGAIVVAALVGCGGGGGGSHADVCESCISSAETVEACREDCECVFFLAGECFGAENEEEREFVRECQADCRTCGEGLFCSLFFQGGRKCAIDDGGATCCNGNREVPCD